MAIRQTAKAKIPPIRGDCLSASLSVVCVAAAKQSGDSASETQKKHETKVRKQYVNFIFVTLKSESFLCVNKEAS